MIEKLSRALKEKGNIRLRKNSNQKWHTKVSIEIVLPYAIKAVKLCAMALCWARVGC